MQLVQFTILAEFLKKNLFYDEYPGSPRKLESSIKGTIIIIYIIINIFIIIIIIIIIITTIIAYFKKYLLDTKKIRLK